jgi:DNA-directed RNA polymerase specialized sigma24 family protein
MIHYLTSGRKRIMKLIDEECLSLQQVADRLGLSLRTVQTGVHSIFASIAKAKKMHLL